MWAGEATEFQAAFPRVRYRRVATGGPLPFANKSFDVATSNAVLEHVGSRENQARFIAEMVRVARRVFISVPHRFFPVEHHTAIPLAHWTDTTWFLACAVTGKQKWSQDKELILMSARHLLLLVPPGSAHQVGYTGLLLGLFELKPLSYNHVAASGSSELRRLTGYEENLPAILNT